MSVNQEAAATMPALPTEVILHVLDQATPRYLEVLVRCGPKSDMPYRAPHSPLQVRHSNSSNWELVRRLKSLSPSIAALTGVHSKVPIRSSTLLVCFDTYDDVSEALVEPDIPNPAVLSWSKRMVIRVPIAMRPQWGAPILGNVSLAYTLQDGQWKPYPQDTAWVPLPGQTAAKVQNPPAMGPALIKNISTKIPEEFLKEKISSDWLKRLWWMVREATVATRRSSALSGHPAWIPPMGWRVSALEDSAARVADRELPLANKMWSA